MAENRADHLGLGDGGDNPQRSLTAKWTSGHSQRQHPLQQPRPAPVRRGVAGLRLFYALLAWRRRDRPTPQTVRRQTAPIADQVDPRQRHERHQFLEQCQRRPCEAGRAVRPRLGERGDEVPTGIFVETIERYGASYSVPNQALQLVTPVRWDVGVGVQRKPMDTGTAGTCECGAFPCIPKARANPSHLLSDTLPKGKTLFHGGRRGAGELGSRTPSTPAGGHASPRALACRPARRGCLARAPRSQAEHGAAWLWFVLDMCLRMG